ncbi:MAG: beta-ketoacyl-[acyl-carrier-protein] synthase family protein [Deltaproteobacteria bacterium]|nr:beta-ketoacyl-[acyl-carrier-protein] synthase family protein [Deltaproteobacteria bacterium]
MDRRVVITGIGMVTPLGVGKEAFAEALWQGRTGIGEIAAFSTDGLGSHLGGEVRAFSARDFISVKNLRKMDRLSAMATASCRMALDDAGIGIDPANRDRIGIVMGTAYGNTEDKVQSARVLFTEGPGRVSPIHVPNTVMNAPAGYASIELGFRGVNTTVNHQAVSAETAIAYGAMEIRRGAAEVILAGGGEILSPFFYEALDRFRALSPVGGGAEGARPFDRLRNGPVLGEGCGMVCLEAADAARERGATVYAEVTGWGLGSSPAPATAWPADPRGFLLTLERTFRMAGAAPKEIDLIGAAANGGCALDALEAAAYERLFSDAKDRPLITALKGATGEIFASGGIRAAALALSLREGIVPPVVGLREPLCGLPFVCGDFRRKTITKALLSGISFGGTYGCLVLEGDRGKRAA